MYSVKNSNRFQLATISYFILGNLAFSLLFSALGITPNVVVGLLVSQVFMVGLSLLVYTLYTKSSLVTDFYVRPIHWKDGLICVGIAWCIMPLLSFINVLSQFFVQNQIQDAMAQLMSLPLLVTLFLTGVLPATLEELISRSVILRHGQKKTVLVTCMASGMFFGFLHLNINQFLYAFIMGMVMCYIVMVTGSVLSSMIIHFVINATGTVMLYTLNALLKVFENNEALLQEMMVASQPTTMQLAISAFTMFVVAAFFTPVAVILIRMLLERHGKTFSGSLKMYTEDFMALGTATQGVPFKDNIQEARAHGQYTAPKEEEKFWTVPLVITTLLFIAFSLLAEL